MREGGWHLSGWPGIAKGVAQRMARDGAPGRAAEMAYYFFLSVFPILLVVLALLGLFLDAQQLVRNTVLDHLAAIAPESISSLFERMLDRLADQPGRPLSVGIVIGVWAGSSGMVATIRALNRAYDVAEERSWWRRRLIGIVLTIVLVFFIAVAMLLLAYGTPIAEMIAQQLGLGALFVIGGRIAQWAVILAFLLLAFAVLYRFGPHRQRPAAKWFLPGTLIAIVLWLIASMALKLYVANIARYDVAYGSVGAVIVLLLWFYVASLAVLTGAEINARLERE